MMTLGHVLVADDDQLSLDVTAAGLRKSGYECDTAPDGDQATALLRAKDFDLLISDLEMPGNLDLELIHRVPQIAPGLPVILVTATPTIESAIQSVRLPVAAYLLKPLQWGELLPVVHRSVSAYRAYRILVSTRERLETHLRDVQRVESMMLGAPKGILPDALHIVLKLSLRSMSATTEELLHLHEIYSAHPPSPGLRAKLDGIRPLKMVEALQETILVIEKTKSHFRSKDLAELRRKLEALVQTEAPERSCCDKSHDPDCVDSVD